MLVQHFFSAMLNGPSVRSWWALQMLRLSNFQKLYRDPLPGVPCGAASIFWTTKPSQTKKISTSVCWTTKRSQTKKIPYNILGLMDSYDFSIKFIYILDCMKKL